MTDHRASRPKVERATEGDSGVRQASIERARRGLRAAHEALDGLHWREGDKRFVRDELVPDGLVALDEVEAALAEAERQRDEARATNAQLNRRAQAAEAVADQNVEACKRAGASFGRGLANYAAARNEERALAAEAALADTREALRHTRDVAKRAIARLLEVEGTVNSAVLAAGQPSEARSPEGGESRGGESP